MPFTGAAVQTVRKELKTVEGGFVEIRRMKYGEKLQRAGFSRLAIDMNSRSRDIKGELDMANAEVTYLGFANCIVSHNLFKDPEEQHLFNFASRDDVDSLPGPVGEEIDKYINEINNFEEDDEVKN